MKRAADYIVRHGPHTKQERWENQSGWSPGTIASEIAGLVCAADLASRAGDVAGARAVSARRRLVGRERAGVDRNVENRTSSRNIGSTTARWSAAAGSLAPVPYFVGRSGARSFVRRSFIVNTVSVVDQVLGVRTPNGPFWRRFTFDGYGETRAGAPWGIGKPDTFRTFGRAWPIFAGERGE